MGDRLAQIRHAPPQDETADRARGRAQQGGSQGGAPEKIIHENHPLGAGPASPEGGWAWS